MDGFAICPYLQKYIDRIDVRPLGPNSPDYKGGWGSQMREDIDTAVQDIWDHKYEAVVLYGKTVYDDDIYPREGDVEVLHMEANSTEPPLYKIADYTLKTHDLVIVQRKSTLEQARKRLEKTTYYDHWREDQ
tara:strand:- start:315 stop:710 length:396 start_codon:yes stop_codon:yes gene_type:complete